LTFTTLPYFVKIGADSLAYESFRNGKSIFNGYSFQYYSTYWQYAFNRVLKWRAYSQHSQDFNIGKVIDMGTVQPISKAVLDAYDAPFPSEEYKAGARIFPTLVPIHGNPESIKNIEAWEKLKLWNKPF
jgi:hypothetical protein